MRKSYKSIINLQGDMPLIDVDDINKVNEPILKGFDIGTLATNLSIEEESNICLLYTSDAADE